MCTLKTDRPAIENHKLGVLASEAVRLERLNDSSDKLRELMERWDNRLTFKGLSFIERYLKGSLKFLAVFDILRGGETHHYHAILYRAKSDTFHFDDKLVSLRYGDIRHSNIIEYGNQHLVLVRNVEIMNGTKRFIPSFVRFEPANDIDDIWAGSIYISLFNHMIKVIPTSSEREINTVNIGTVEPNKVAGKKVKRSSKIMNGVSDKTGAITWSPFSDPDARNLFTTFRAIINDNNIRISFQECGDFRVQIRDVALGPFNL
jgi:hypothetical protein